MVKKTKDASGYHGASAGRMSDFDLKLSTIGSSAKKLKTAEDVSGYHGSSMKDLQIRQAKKQAKIDKRVRKSDRTSELNLKLGQAGVKSKKADKGYNRDINPK